LANTNNISNNSSFFRWTSKCSFFSFRIVIDGQESFVTKVANLGNVVPEFFTIEALNINTPPVSYGPGGTQPFPAEVQTNKGTKDIAIININNGSASLTDPNPNGGRALSTRDLRIVDQQDNDFAIWDQRLNSPNGPVAEINAFGDPQPIFSLEPITPITSNGNIQVRLVNDFFDDETVGLMSAGVYYITLALQDAGETLIFQTIEVDMRVQLDNNNFWNKIQQVDAYGYEAETYPNNPFLPENDTPPQYILPSTGSQTGNPVVPSGCGEATFCQPPVTDTKWWNYPSCLFQITDSDIGASTDTYGWYIYAMGYFNNTADADLCCDTNNSHGIAASTSLVEYSNADFTNTITIPMNTPITDGNHLVQKQTTDTVNFPITAAQIPLWGLPPLIHGRIAVTAHDPSTNLWTYEVLEGDPDKALTGCMKLFRDYNGTVSQAGFGWNIIDYDTQLTKAQMKQRVLDGFPCRRTSRIKLTQIEAATGNKQFYFEPLYDSGGSVDGVKNGGVPTLEVNWDFSAQGPQIIYTYGGPQNYATSPWFFVPTNGTTTTMDPILEIWAMYTYSGWVGSKWRVDRKKWTQWCQRWRADEPFVNPPITLDSGDIDLGIQRLLDNGNPGCLAWPEHMAQESRPTNAGDYQYAII